MSRYEITHKSVDDLLFYFDFKQTLKYAEGDMGWRYDTDAKPEQVHDARKNYNATFENILAPFTSFKQLVEYRKSSGKSTHVLDLFGSGKFFVDTTDSNSVLGIRSKDILTPNEKQSHPSLWTVLEGNIYDLYSGKNNSDLACSIETYLDQHRIEGFDIITCRPVGPFSHTFRNEESVRVGELLHIYNELLNVVTGYLNPNRGELYTCIPSMGIRQELIRQFGINAQLQNHTVEVADAAGSIRNADDMVLKVTKTPYSPNEFEPLPCVSFIE